MKDFVLFGKLIKECLTMFGVIILTQMVIMEFIQTNEESELLVLEGCGYIRDRQITAVLKNAMTESGYAMNKSKLPLFIAIYLIQQILKRENSARR